MPDFPVEPPVEFVYTPPLYFEVQRNHIPEACMQKSISYTTQEFNRAGAAEFSKKNFDRACRGNTRQLVKFSSIEVFSFKNIGIILSHFTAAVVPVFMSIILQVNSFLKGREKLNY